MECPLPVTVVVTVKDDAAACRDTLVSLCAQSRPPAEIIVVDGGSADGTVDLIRHLARQHKIIRVIEAPGANIARGRNLGTRAARTEIVATTDCGCTADPHWLEQLATPFEQCPDAEFVAGFYQINPKTLLETVVGLATMRGQLERVNPRTFNPSARSLAFRKSLWERAGGWPDWIRFSEDTLFDHKVRRLTANWHFAEQAVVHWRPRSSFRAIARQFFNYGTGRGHTQIDAASSRYNLRNAVLTAAAAASCLVTSWGGAPFAAAFAYFYIVAFHRKACRIVRRTQTWQAYPVTLLVIWTVMAAHLAGYLMGTVQRVLNGDRYRRRLREYLTCPVPG